MFDRIIIKISRWTDFLGHSVLTELSWQFLSRRMLSVVDPGTFQEFYKCWKQGEVELGQVATLNDFVDPSTEVLIKVSQLISCSFGNGRVVLTHDRQVTFCLHASFHNICYVILWFYVVVISLCFCHRTVSTEALCFLAVRPPHSFVCLSVCPFIRTYLITTISHERLEQSWWNLHRIFTSPDWWSD